MNTPFAVRQDGKFSVEEYLALIESPARGGAVAADRRGRHDDAAAHASASAHRLQSWPSNSTRIFARSRPELCALQEVGLIVPEAELFRPEADVAVLDPIGRLRVLRHREFYSVAEILSDSNTDKDIAVKRQRYLQHPDNLYFLLIEQKRVHVEVMAARRRPASRGARPARCDPRSSRSSASAYASPTSIAARPCCSR